MRSDLVPPCLDAEGLYRATEKAGMGLASAGKHLWCVKLTGQGAKTALGEQAYESEESNNFNGVLRVL